MSSRLKLFAANLATSGIIPAMLLAVTLTGCSFGTTEIGNGTASIHVAEAALNAGSPRVALQVVQNILDRSPDDTHALLIRGDALTQLAQNEQAASTFQRALRKDPASVHGKLGLARIRLTTDPNDAVGLLRDILHTEPNNISALTDLGVALDLLGQHAEAQTFYRRVMRDNPDNVAVRVNLSLSLAMSGDSAEALRLIEPLARDRSAPIKIRHNYAAILTMAGRRSEAASVLKGDLSPEDTNRALAAYKQGTAVALATPAQPIPPTFQEVALTPPPVIVATAEHAPAAPPPMATLPELPRRVAALVAPPFAALRTETVEVTQTSAPLTTVPAATVLTPVTPAYEVPVPFQAAPIVAAGSAAAPPASPTALESTDMEIGPHVQLGAFNSEIAASREWRRLQQKLPAALSGREPAITTVERNGTTFWRLRTWGFPDQATARGFCAQIRAVKSRCMVFGA